MRKELLPSAIEIVFILLEGYGEISVADCCLGYANSACNVYVCKNGPK